MKIFSFFHSNRAFLCGTTKQGQTSGVGRLDSYRICGILRSDSSHSNSKSHCQIFVQSSKKITF